MNKNSLARATYSLYVKCFLCYFWKMMGGSLNLGGLVLTAAGAAASRVGGAVLGVGVEMLKAEHAESAGTAILRFRLEKLMAQAPENEYLEARKLLSQGKYIEVQVILKRHGL